MEMAIHQENTGILSLLDLPQLRIQTIYLSNLDRESYELPVEN